MCVCGCVCVCVWGGGGSGPGHGSGRVLAAQRGRGLGGPDAGGAADEPPRARGRRRRGVPRAQGPARPPLSSAASALPPFVAFVVPLPLRALAAWSRSDPAVPSPNPKRVALVGPRASTGTPPRPTRGQAGWTPSLGAPSSRPSPTSSFPTGSSTPGRPPASTHLSGAARRRRAPTPGRWWPT